MHTCVMFLCNPIFYLIICHCRLEVFFYPKKKRQQQHRNIIVALRLTQSATSIHLANSNDAFSLIHFRDEKEEKNLQIWTKHEVHITQIML